MTWLGGAKVIDLDLGTGHPLRNHIYSVFSNVKAIFSGWFGTCFIFPNTWDDDPI